MRTEVFLGFSYIANTNYYLNPDLFFPKDIVETISLSEIKLKPEKSLRRIREYTTKAYENLKKIL